MAERDAFVCELLEMDQCLAGVAVDVQMIFAQRIAHKKDHSARLAAGLRSGARRCGWRGGNMASDHRRAPISPQPLLLTRERKFEQYAFPHIGSEIDSLRLPPIRNRHGAFEN